MPEQVMSISVSKKPAWDLGTLTETPQPSPGTYYAENVDCISKVIQKTTALKLGWIRIH